MQTINILSAIGWLVLILAAAVFTSVLWYVLANWPPKVKPAQYPQAFKPFEFDNRPASQRP